MKTILDFISEQARTQPEAIALLAPGREALDFAGLVRQIESTIDALNAMGVGRGDTLAIVLPNGPEMAAAFLGAASACGSAPLNPNYKESEFAFYLEDLQARALLVLENDQTPALAAARSLNVPVINLRPGIQAGQFSLDGALRPLENTGGRSQPEDVALILHTSGTTSRPKIVPLSQANLCASARNVAGSLALTPADRCLNVMPLFHIHGLVAATLASLYAGASLICSPGFYAPRFFEWLESFQPSWYSAVPTMHQAILARLNDEPDGALRAKLRFIRSSSASLPPLVMAQLEQAFNAPVIEAYGMTEAAHQMASNPLPPKERKPGSVGVAAGPQVAIMAEDSPVLLPPGATGEIVIQGPNVTAGYARNPTANEKAFSAGWFRTGDQGYLDAEGYLYITGRLKELINRGGEKISPREVDEVLLGHPAVKQAVTFAMPHPTLGETVAAAVTLNQNANAEPVDLQRFLAGTLAYFKVPEQIVILDEIPKGPTGKLQRIGLAEKLGLKAEVSGGEELPGFVAPRNDLEKVLANLWCEVLNREQVGVHDRFLDSGGDSMLALLLAQKVQAELGVDIELVDLFNAVTIAEQAQLVLDRM